MILLPSIADPHIQALIDDHKDAERETYEWQRYVALFDDDKRMARAQRLLDQFPLGQFPALVGMSSAALVAFGGAFARGIAAGLIAAPLHIGPPYCARPSRRANRRAHSRKVKHG